MSTPLYSYADTRGQRLTTAQLISTKQALQKLMAALFPATTEPDNPQPSTQTEKGYPEHYTETYPEAA